LKKGPSQITGFGNFEARKRAARWSQSEDGRVIQIKASIAPAFRPGNS